MLKFLNMNEEITKKKVQVVVIAENSALLLEFNNQKLNNYVGFQNITGEVEGVESFEVAALREVVEEIGVDAPAVIDLKTEFKFLDRWKKNCFEKVYLCFLSKKPDIYNPHHQLFLDNINQSLTVIAESILGRQVVN